MESGGQSEVPAPGASDGAQASGLVLRAVKRRPLRAGDVQFYRLCEDLTEPLIYFMVVVGPWAFGTTQSWSIWLMNGTGYLLGLLLAGKLAIRWAKGYEPDRWGEGRGGEGRSPKVEGRRLEGGGRGRGRGGAGRRTAILAGVGGGGVGGGAAHGYPGGVDGCDSGLLPGQRH